MEGFLRERERSKALVEALDETVVNFPDAYITKEKREELRKLVAAHKEGRRE